MKNDSTIGHPLRFLLLIPVPWVFVLAYLIGVGIERTAPPLGGLTLHATELAGGVVFLIGAFIAGWALTLFRKARTTTVPGQVSANLVTSGPYRFSRNPMYVGLSLAYLGEAGLLKQVWPVAVLPLVIIYLNWVVIPLEEARLREVFGDAYRSYCERVRRWL
jgi:protein-S-isoprenylcysteine O-methyltransferase Ste14